MFPGARVGYGVGPAGLGIAVGEAVRVPAGVISPGELLGRTKMTGELFGDALGVGVGSGGGVAGVEVGAGVLSSWREPCTGGGKVGVAPGAGVGDAVLLAAACGVGNSCAITRAPLPAHELEFNSDRTRA